MTAVLFDMDGVLVDVSRSYREAVHQTIFHFSGRDVSDEEIQSNKNKGGYNNDWDLSLKLLQDRGFKLSKGEVVDAFQKIYLGRDFNGLIRNERWLLKKDLLMAICQRFPTGIVTGRPRKETDYVLNRFSVDSFFPVVVTMDDVPPGKDKPDPYGILLALRALEEQHGLYFGDTVDDMKAARKASLTPVGIAREGKSRREQTRILRESGASAVLSDINDLMEVLP